MFNIFKKKVKSKDIVNPIDNINIDNYNDLDINNNLTKLILEEIELEKFSYLNKGKKEELNDLYQIIFNTYTYFPYNCLFNKYYISLNNEKEKEYYRNIISY